jgi:shikimate dehydrogenase
MYTITGKTRLLGIIGDPVDHSLSPPMQNAAIAALGVDYIYVPFAVKPVDLATAIAGLDAIGVLGFNATIPHKQAIIPFLDKITDRAKLIGAVNTVWRTPSGWAGTNTDVDGFLAPLKDFDKDWTAIAPVILGCGGAARAVVVGLLELGCPAVTVVGRNLEKLAVFEESWQASGLGDRVRTARWDVLPALLPEAELLVNTTPIGMMPHSDRSPVEAALMERLPSSAIAYDLIYTPSPTVFLKQARQQGLIAIDGLEMLVQQGAAALALWLNRPAPADIMRHALRSVF